MFYCTDFMAVWRYGWFENRAYPVYIPWKTRFCETKQEKAWYNNKVGRKSDVEIDLHGREQLGG